MRFDVANSSNTCPVQADQNAHSTCKGAVFCTLGMEHWSCDASHPCPEGQVCSAIKVPFLPTVVAACLPAN
jgi:hypothetical protein